MYGPPDQSRAVQFGYTFTPSQLPPVEPDVLLEDEELLELDEDELELLEEELELVVDELELLEEELEDELDELELLELEEELPPPGSTPQTRPLLSYTGILGASAP